MSKMNEAGKRDFVSQMITLVEEEQVTMNEKGFDPATKVESLKTKKENVSKVEIAQQEAAAKAKEATTYANVLLDEAYKEASNMADLLSGLYGKESEIIKKIRKFRK
jgi:transcriptional regulator